LRPGWGRRARMLVSRMGLPVITDLFSVPPGRRADIERLLAELTPGQTVALIEAMKVMNEIKAEKAGRLRDVMAEDGAPVEYGQILFVFDPL